MMDIQTPQWREFVSELNRQNLARGADELETVEAVFVTVASTQGSAPREAGTWMAVFDNKLVGTIGGGHVEFEASKQAREFLSRRQDLKPFEQRYVLGTNLGQCCGGVMTLCYEKYSTIGNKYAGYNLKSHINSVETSSQNAITAQSRLQVALFGGGHVGKAIVRILGALPMQVMWVDSRDEIFPTEVPHNTITEHSDPVQGAVNDLPTQSHVLIMSFSHAEDLDIVAACLLRQRERADLPFIGLIGSKTKWATFRHRLDARGFTESELSHVTCPIGVTGIRGKEPEVIAVAVAAQLLQLSKMA
ncbi:MAG TPA: xanthine dehydrogenase accessory protein XdhC [Burkholderiaceae bacterium]|nr:xanthine dehydrogenase accessory protein XdhC [Burkholderiaceae bacterium]